MGGLGGLIGAGRILKGCYTRYGGGVCLTGGFWIVDPSPSSTKFISVICSASSKK